MPCAATSRPATCRWSGDFTGRAACASFAERLGCTNANGGYRRITFVADVAAIPVVSADGRIVCTAYFDWNGDAARRADVGADFLERFYKSEVTRMNTTATRIMLALTCGLLWAGPARSANEMRFSDTEARIATVEQKTSAIPGLRPVAFLSDGDAIDAIAPNDAVSANGEEVMASLALSHGAACGSGNPCCCDSARTIAAARAAARMNAAAATKEATTPTSN